MDTSTEQDPQNRPSSKDTSSKKDDQAGGKSKFPHILFDCIKL